jgi:hypothetical protein
MDKFVEYAPWLVVVLMFLWQNKIFVTPEQMEKKFRLFEHDMETKFVLQQTHDIAITSLKSDMADVKDKVDKIYDMIYNMQIKG